MIKGGNSINRYRVFFYFFMVAKALTFYLKVRRWKKDHIISNQLVLCHVTSTRTCTSTHNLVSTQVNMFNLEEERTSKWFSFTNTTCMHRIFTFAWDRENSWNHILNKNFLIEGITLKKSRNKVFVRGFSHENLMRLSWAFNAREKMRFSPVKKLMRKSHENVIFSWESHENLTRFLWAFSSHEKNEILMSKIPHERFSWELENSHENVIFSWESHEILMRIQKLMRIFVRDSFSFVVFPLFPTVMAYVMYFLTRQANTHTHTDTHTHTHTHTHSHTHTHTHTHTQHTHTYMRTYTHPYTQVTELGSRALVWQPQVAFNAITAKTLSTWRSTARLC